MGLGWRVRVDGWVVAALGGGEGRRGGYGMLPGEVWFGWEKRMGVVRKAGRGSSVRENRREETRTDENRRAEEREKRKREERGKEERAERSVE